MDTAMIMWIMAALGAALLAYMIYTRQAKWVFHLVRNALLGLVGMLGANFLLASAGLAVGINALTVFVISVLGLPGFLLLYVTRMMV